MTREEAIETLLESNEMFKQQGFNRYLTTAIDKVCESPWISVKEMPVNEWVWCIEKSTPDKPLPYLAKLYEDGECFDVECDLCVPDYWMPIPPLKEEEEK